MTIHLTTLESQVMDIFGRAAEANPDRRLTSFQVCLHGHELFHWPWGEDSETHAHPTINGAIGRLGRKGLIERHNSLIATRDKRSFGRWTLSDQGRVLLGLI